MKTASFILAIVVFLSTLLIVSYFTMHPVTLFFALALGTIMCVLVIHIAHEDLRSGWFEHGFYSLLLIVSAVLTYICFFTALLTDFAGQTPIDLVGFKAVSFAWFISGVLGIIYLLATKKKLTN